GCRSRCAVPRPADRASGAAAGSARWVRPPVAGRCRAGRGAEWECSSCPEAWWSPSSGPLRTGSAVTPITLGVGLIREKISDPSVENRGASPRGPVAGPSRTEPSRGHLARQCTGWQRDPHGQSEQGSGVADALTAAAHGLAPTGLVVLTGVAIALGVVSGVASIALRFRVSFGRITPGVLLGRLVLGGLRLLLLGRLVLGGRRLLLLGRLVLGGLRLFLLSRLLLGGLRLLLLGRLVLGGLRLLLRGLLLGGLRLLLGRLLLGGLRLLLRGLLLG